MYWAYLALLGTLVWVSVLLVPWRPWQVREQLKSKPLTHPADLSDITVLIPARNEATTVRAVLSALYNQGSGIKIILVDDRSVDGTAQLARSVAQQNLRIVSGHEPPEGWSGKLWALEQGRAYVHTPLVSLIDADIELGAGLLVTLREKMERDDLAFISLMASLHMRTFWEKLLMPAFVYFFKLLYPFHLSNKTSYRNIAAAAGGCVLLKTEVLDEIGGFHSLRDSLIDDCALAKRTKSLGYKTWIGLTHDVHSLRAYDGLVGIWGMVARCAFTQLRYSLPLLLACTGVFAIAFWLPVAGVMFPDANARLMSTLALAAMMLSYIPTLLFYRRSPVWALAMPLIGTFYLAMTWTSAMRYWYGQRSSWKDRVYTRTIDSGSS